MKCSFCGYKFKQKQANLACKGCFMAKGCKLIRCPNCGFETAPEPEWISLVRNKASEGFAALSLRISNGVKKIFKRRGRDGID